MRKVFDRLGILLQVCHPEEDLAVFVQCSTLLLLHGTIFPPLLLFKLFPQNVSEGTLFLRPEFGLRHV